MSSPTKGATTRKERTSALGLASRSTTAWTEVNSYLVKYSLASSHSCVRLSMQRDKIIIIDVANEVALVWKKGQSLLEQVNAEGNTKGATAILPSMLCGSIVNGQAIS